MAITRSRNGLEVLLDAGRSLFHHGRESIQDALAKSKVYRATYYELSMLTDRDLSDLGIPRSDIRRLALEAAYGS